MSQDRTREALQAIVTGRKSWKTLKGKGEAVWPPHLESALIQALGKYRPPDDSKSTRMLGRFPLRNRFISNYIFEATGKYRTPKQVGSRLQQLRDTCGGKRILNMLSCQHDNDLLIDQPAESSITSFQQQQNQNLGLQPRLSLTVPGPGPSIFNPINIPISPVSSSSSLLFQPSTSYSQTNLNPGFHAYSYFNSHMHPHVDTHTAPRTLVSIDILPPSLYPNYSHHPNSSSENSSAHTHSSAVTYFRPSPTPRHILSIDPTVTFTAPTRIAAQSSFAVYRRGRSVPVFSEVTQLICTTAGIDTKENKDGEGNTNNDDGNKEQTKQDGLAEASGPFLYRTTLVPGFWNELCDSPDPTQYTIFQEITKSHPPGLIGEGASPVILSALYQFKYPSLSQLQLHAQIPAPADESSPPRPSAREPLLDRDAGLDLRSSWVPRATDDHDAFEPFEPLPSQASHHANNIFTFVHPHDQRAHHHTFAPSFDAPQGFDRFFAYGHSEPEDEDENEHGCEYDYDAPSSSGGSRPSTCDSQAALASDMDLDLPAHYVYGAESVHAQVQVRDEGRERDASFLFPSQLGMGVSMGVGVGVEPGMRLGEGLDMGVGMGEGEGEGVGVGMGMNIGMEFDTSMDTGMKTRSETRAESGTGPQFSLMNGVGVGADAGAYGASYFGGM